MNKFICEKCQQGFQQKSQYTRHLNRKTPCILNKSNSVLVISRKNKPTIIDDSDCESESDTTDNDIISKETENIVDNVLPNVDLTGYKFIDLFCGVGGFHQALARMNATCVLACDIDKDCREVYKENYGLEPVRDVKDINENTMEDFDILCGGFPCFVAGTMVLTNNGYKKIEDVTLDDKLLTHTGTYQNIVNLQRKIYSGNLYNISIECRPYKIICTEEHPFYVRRCVKFGNVCGSKNTTMSLPPEWKKAHDLSSDDYFGMVINSNEKIPIFKFDQVKYGKTKKLEIELDDLNMWFLMGYFMGGGWTIKYDEYNGRKICFIINYDYENEIREKISKILDINSVVKNNTPIIENEMWYQILSSFENDQNHKTIPYWIHDAPHEFIEEFINGYRATENYTRDRNNVKMCLNTLEQAYDFQRLFLKLGHIMSVDVRNDVKNNYMLTGNLTELNTNNIYGFIEDNYAWFKVKTDIYTSPVLCRQVYNFEVETDNSYIVENTIVHNCQSFSNGGKKKAFGDDRGLLFDEIMRIAKVKQPKFMFLENVKHILKVSNGEVIEYIKDRIAKVGYNLQIFQISPHNYGIPQQRERVYFVCVRNDIYNGNEITLPKYTGKLEFEKYLDKKEDIDDKYFIKGDILDVLNAWDEMVKKFEVGEKISPTIMINDAYRGYTQEEFENFPDWKKEYITKNKPLLKKYKEEFDEWYKKYENTLLKREIYGKLEWQTGEIKKNDSIFNHFIQLRQSGIRVKKSQYFPTLVAISQIPIYGREKRYITPRECARLQSFPESFKLAKEDKKSYKQMGNSVNVDNVFTVISSTMRNYV